MSLKFNCPHCGAEIVSKYLRIGEQCLCRQCQKRFAVPEEAVAVEGESTLIDDAVRQAERITPDDYVSQRLASRGGRYWARFLDGLMFGAVYMTSLILLAQFLADLEEPLATWERLVILLSPTALYIGLEMYLLAASGQTLGKKWCKIKIVDHETGGPVGFRQSVLLREVLNGVMSLVPLYGLVDALFIFRKDRRCLHDLISGTDVVNVDWRDETGSGRHRDAWVRREEL
jgi:uncharacterized RDD family membrane protein YckC